MTKILLSIVVVVIAIFGVVFVLYIVGESMDTYSQYSQDKERCLKHAANGYEIKRCN